MPRIVSIPSRGVQVEFPDSLPDEEIDAYLAEKYPRSGEDVAFEVEQAKAQSIESRNWINPVWKMPDDDFILFNQYLANKKTSLGDFLGIAKDTFTNVIDEIGTGLGAAAYTAAQGEFGKVAESTRAGVVAGTIGLADIAAKILTPTSPIPKKEEFIGKAADPKSAAFLGMGGMGNTFRQGVNTEADYKALVQQEKQRAADAIDRLYAIEDTLQGAPIEEIARGAQNIDPTLLTGLSSTAVRSLATKLAGKSIFKPAAIAAAKKTTADAIAQAAGDAAQFTVESGSMPIPRGMSTAPGRLGQAALSGIERAASGVQTAASLPGQALQGIRNVAERVAPGTGAAAQGTALATGLMADMGLTAGTLAGAATAEKAAEVVGAAARAARKEASRVGLLEQAAQDAAISPAARKFASGLAQLQPVFRGASQAAAQALKEGAAGAAVGAGLGYLAERNLEGAAQGAGAGAAFGGLTGTMRSVFDMGREMVGGSTSRTRQQAAGDLNTFLAERPEVEQAAWSQTINRLVEQVGPERAAAQVDAMKIAEANGAKVRVATPDEMKQWQNPGWLDVSTQEVVLNPNKILGDTAAHETSHVLFSSAINRAFKPEIEQAVFGLADPVTGEIVRPGLFDDIALAKVADQIGDSYGNNTQAANEFKGYANVLRNTTDAAALQEARTRIADEMSAAYTGNLFGRLRPGRFNPDRLPLVYRNALNALEDSILDKFRSVLFEKGMDLGFDSVSRTFKDAKGKPIRIPELDAIVKRALAKRGTKAAQAPTAKPDLIPVNPADRAIWARSYGGARGILNDDNTPKTAAQIQAEATARWQDMTQRMAALPETERKGIEFNRDSTGKTVMTAKGQLSPEALNVILDSGTIDPSAKAVLRDVLTSMQNFNKATFDTRYYGVYDRGIGRSKMVAGVKSVSQNEILPYSVEMNSKEGVIIRAVDMTKVRDRLATALTKPQFKDVYASPQAALKDFNLYLENITQINPVDSATLLGGGEKGAKKRNLFYDALGFRLRNNESLRNAPESIISKSQNTVKSYRVERFAKLQDSGNRFAFEEATTYERAMKNFQPDAFARETLPAGETLTNPDGYRILKKTGGKLFRVYDDNGALLGTSSSEDAAMKKAQSDYAKKVEKESKKPSIIEAPPVVREFADGYKLTQPGLIRFQPVRAYHGTPHKVDKFTTDKIGTGEGAQAYGWGLYFAKARAVAEEYRKTLSTTITVGGKQLLKNNQKITSTGDSYVDNLLIAHDGDLESAIASERVYADSMAAQSKQSRKTATGDPYEILNKLIALQQKQSVEVQTTGNLYTVELLPDEADFLDWDKPLSEQSEKVKAALYSAYEARGVDTQQENFGWQSGQMAYKAMMDEGARKEQRKLPPSKRNNGSLEKQASEYLASLGIPGIRYLDGQSRGSGEGTHNYVIFDENLVKIIEENGKPVGESPAIKRFQPVTPEQDAAFLRAAQAGDTATTQKMVDEAAKKAGYVVKAHAGHRAGITVYDPTRKTPFFSKSKAVAESYVDVYGDDDGRGEMDVKNVYLKLGKSLIVDFEGKSWMSHPKTGVDADTIAFGADRDGYDSVTFLNIVDDARSTTDRALPPSDEYAIFKPDLIKSADPITYDDAGNIIPLSQRFNVESPDIRFQPDSASPSILNGSNGTRIIKSPSGKFRVYSATGALLGIRDTEETAKKLATK